VKRRRRIHGLAGLGAASLLLAAPARADLDERRPVALPPTPCFDRPIVVAYFHHLEDRVMDRWADDGDSAANQRVVVRFRLDERGALMTYKLVSFTSRRVANAADLAIRHASPFGPVPEAATCIVGRSIELQFENPY